MCDLYRAGLNIDFRCQKKKPLEYVSTESFNKLTGSDCIGEMSRVSLLVLIA